MKKYSNRLNDFDAFDEKMLEKSLKALESGKKAKSVSKEKQAATEYEN